MSRTATIIALVLILLTGTAAALYVASDRLIAWTAVQFLSRQGIVATVEARRPTTNSLKIPRVTLSSPGWHITLTDIAVEYSPATLSQSRLSSIVIGSAQIAINTSAGASAGTEEIPDSPWTLLPADRLVAKSFNISFSEPALELGGTASMSPAALEAHLIASGASLPLPLEGNVAFSASGQLDVNLARSDGADLLSAKAEPSGNRIDIVGRFDLDSATVATLASVLGLPHTSGTLSGDFRAGMPRIIVSTASSPNLQDVDLTLSAANRISIDLPGLATLETDGTVMASLAGGAVSLSSAAQGVTVRKVRFGNREIVMQDAQILLKQTEAKFTLKDMPDLPARLSVSSDASVKGSVPGDIAVLPDTSISGAHLEGDWHVDLAGGQLSLKARDLTAAAREVTWKGVRYELGHEDRISLDVDAGLPVESLVTGNAAFTTLRSSATLSLNVTSSDRNALIGESSIAGSAEAALRDQSFELTLAKGFNVGAYDGVREYAVKSLAPFALQYDLTDGKVQLDNASLSASVLPLEISGQKLAFRDARVALTALSFSGSSLSATGQFKTNSASNAVPVNFSLDADTDKLAGTFNATSNASIARALLKSEVPGWRSPYDLDAGKLSVTVGGEIAVLEKGLSINAKGELQLNGGAAHYDRTTLSGISLTMPFTITDEATMYLADHVSISGIDVGVPAKAITFSVAGDTESVTVSGLQAQILGGAASIDSLRYDLDSSHSAFDVAVRGVNLADILALEGDDISGTGIIDGNLPVLLDDEGISIRTGALAARAPGGHISYRREIGETAPGLDLAISALRNFTYTSLTADANYQPTGALDLKIHLKGSNPDVEKGRPFVFNLNINEDIPALLESLRASEATEERVQQRLSR
ncbi:MAG: YdbH domain-containing protein [Pseudomonadales bacterium]|nr:YdbH domain-containing protein [Pseudomonadales bacterium]